jgi:hypothetical protein
MKKLLASVLCAALAMSATPISLIAAGKALRFQAGQIAGQATVDGKPLGNVKVRLRNIDTKQLAGEMQADAAGNFSFTGLPAGNFVVETIGANGTILGTSTVIALTAGALVATGVLVSTSAAALGAAGGATAVGAAAGALGGGGGFLGLTTATAFAVAGGAAIITTTAIVVANNNASPSQ